MPVEPERRTATGRALLEGRVIHIADVLDDPDYGWAEAQKLGDFRTILGVPMLREGIPIGVLALTRSEVRPFTDKQIELVSTSPIKPPSRSRTCGCSMKSRRKADSSRWQASINRSSSPA